MPNKHAVTQAQLVRAARAFEAMGKTVTAVRLWPDGRADVLIDGNASPTVAAKDDGGTLESLARREGYE